MSTKGQTFELTGEVQSLLVAGTTGHLEAIASVPFLHKGELCCANYPHPISRVKDGTGVTLRSIRPGVRGTITVRKRPHGSANFRATPQQQIQHELTNDA